MILLQAELEEVKFLLRLYILVLRYSQDALLRLWWLQMSTVMECKSGESAADQCDARLQLCSYARQILKAQLDRRFAIGLTLCLSKLHLYLFDRSGVVGMREPIDIHAVSFLLLLREQLYSFDL
jgi:hypothetical protein